MTTDATVLPAVDVLVIGAGMAGGAITCTLAEAGVEVLCLEQGRWIPGASRPHGDRFYELERSYRWSTSPGARTIRSAQMRSSR